MQIYSRQSHIRQHSTAQFLGIIRSLSFGSRSARLFGNGNGVGNGVGPRQVYDIRSNSAEVTSKNGPIMSYSRAKRLFFPTVYGKIEAALHCDKKSKRSVKGIKCVRDLLSITLFSGQKKKI